MKATFFVNEKIVPAQAQEGSDNSCEVRIVESVNSNVVRDE